MKTTILITTLVILPGLASQVWAGDFKNLDFENADVSKVGRRFPNYPSLEADTSAILPGWGLAYDGAPVLKTQYQSFEFVPLASVQALEVMNNGVRFHKIYPTEGEFSLILGASVDAQGVSVTFFDLTQTGQVPQDAKSIRFLTYGEGFKVFMDSSEIQVNYLKSTSPAIPGINIYLGSADVSSFAGREVELKFQTFVRGGIPGSVTPDISFHAIDSIRFSPDAVPEPGPLGLLAVGAVILAWRWRRG